MKHTLVPQTYGIAMAQGTFGGPRGIWLECTAKDCLTSHKIKGASADMTDTEAAAIFRKGGWTGRGDRMLRAKCPKCSEIETIGEHA